MYYILSSLYILVILYCPLHLPLTAVQIYSWQTQTTRPVRYFFLISSLLFLVGFVALSLSLRNDVLFNLVL